MPLEFDRIPAGRIIPPRHHPYPHRGRERLVLEEVGSRYRIVEGHNIYIRAREAWQHHLDALVRRLHPDPEYRLQEHYRIGGLTPIEEARDLDELRSGWAMSQRDMAARLGTRQSVISKRLSLLQLDHKMQRDIHEGRLTAEEAIRWLRRARRAA